MPIVTPTVQRAEQAADAADAQMSVGKMEIVSRAAAKMTNSVAACDLIGAEIWTLAKTAIELFGASVSTVRKQVHKLRHRFKSHH